MEKQLEKVENLKLEGLDSLELSSAEAYRKACAKLLMVKHVMKEIQEMFAPIKNKTHSAWKESVAQEKKYLSALQEAEMVLRDKINEYAASQEEEPLRAPDISYRNDWKFKVTDELLVPREFLQINEPMIRERVKSLGPIAKIPGVEIWQEKSVVAGAGSSPVLLLNNY